jgi:hypothetical protein
MPFERWDSTLRFSCHSGLPEALTKPHMFDWKILQERMKDTILLGVQNKSNRNGSQAVSIHCGYLYVVNEVVAIPLCKDTLDYCGSTTRVKNEFVSLCKVTTFLMMAQT